jgi:peptidoglycan biosynthesis protein MviN/MurJ (putative lipid II flippase)
MHRHMVVNRIQITTAETSSERPRSTLSLASGFLPLFIASFAAQVVVLTERILASFLPEGTISQLSYAYRLATIPSVLFGMSILTAIFPSLVARQIDGDTAATHDILTSATALALAVLVPASVLIYVLAEPLVQFLFERGAFTSVASARTASATAAYAISIPALALVALASRAVLATGRGGSIIAAAIAGMLTTLTLQLIAVRTQSVSALAFAVTVGIYVQFLWIWSAMTRTCQLRNAWQSPLRWGIAGILTALLLSQRQWIGPTESILALGVCGVLIPLLLWILGERQFNPRKLYRVLRTL